MASLIWADAEFVDAGSLEVQIIWADLFPQSPKYNLYRPADANIQLVWADGISDAGSFKMQIPWVAQMQTIWVAGRCPDAN